MNKRYLYTAFVLSFNVFAGDLKPFTSDGCSLFPDGNFVDDSKWLQCCVSHDLAYWKGGVEVEREKADKELQECVDRAGEKVISTLMHAGVKVGGAPVFPTWYRWGYGWPYTRGYKALTNVEKEQINQRLSELRNLIDKTIQETK